MVVDLIVQLSRNGTGRGVIGYEDSLCPWCDSIRLLSQLNSRLLLVKLSVVRSFSRRYSFS